MAEFKPAFEETMQNEGGYKLHKVKGDRGGQTFAGISRRWHPDWPGWRYIDTGNQDNPIVTQLTRNFFKIKFWDRINGDVFQDQEMAESVYDFGVNADPIVAVKLVQIILGVTPDGIIGPVTSSALNQLDPETFHLKFFIAKIARYAGICNADKTQKKFLLGWVNRSLEVLP